MQDKLRVSCEQYLRGECAKSRKAWILQKRMSMVDSRGREIPIMEFRDYLRVPKMEHRVALTRLICSDHDLAVEVLRRGDGQRRKKIPREWRLCRFCTAAVEAESHALLACTGHADLVELRRVFWADVQREYSGVWQKLSNG
ncbi:hypothetical protein BDZ89DRAFT_996280, partial [Hymenopellis radicata]